MGAAAVEKPLVPVIYNPEMKLTLANFLSKQMKAARGGAKRSRSVRHSFFSMYFKSLFKVQDIRRICQIRIIHKAFHGIPSTHLAIATFF
jgi:hypothetical protein